VKPLYAFSGQDSFLHRLDPRTKLVFVVSYLLASFLIGEPWMLFLILIVAIWLLAGISPVEYYHFLVLMLPLMFAITLVHTVFIGDAPHYAEFDLPGVTLSLSQEGFSNGMALAFRLGTMGLAFTLFAMTTDPFFWGMSMYKWGLPYKVAFMFAFAIRLFPLIQEEFLTIQRALRSRGSRALSSFNPFVFFPGVVMTAVPLGLGAIRRSRDIAIAMELRGLNIPQQTGGRRVLFREPVLRAVDIIILLACIGSLITLFVLRLVG
jgi:energy-coupling factor transport system permease protein